ncbi:hypothetical protein D6T65_17275 [Arthrobacter frigidicola]|nr:hypothetical protein D6T65_17275 [Arthrobacter frigidicola]
MTTSERAYLPTGDTEENQGHPLRLNLQLWRLLDWRFLLPVLEPRSVGYAGAIDRDTKAALGLLNAQASPILPGGEGASVKSFHVVLVSSPDRQLLRAAAAAVEPGGWICVQTRRSIPSRSRPGTLAGVRRALVREGFGEVRIHWHAPGLALPSRIVDAGSTTAVRNTLSRHHTVRFGRVKAAIGTVILALRLFGVAIPEGTVTGSRPVRGDTQ